MLTAYKIYNKHLIYLKLNNNYNNLLDAIWIDLIKPEDNERKKVYNLLGQNLATRPELEDIEASARFFENKEGLHIHSFFFYRNKNEYVGTTTVAFTIKNNRLYTLREKELSAFRLYRIRMHNNNTMTYGNPYELLLDILDTKIEQLADEIENIYSDLELLSCIIMKGHKNDQFDNALSTLAELEDIGWKVRLCLMDTQRAVNFLMRKTRLPKIQIEQAREISRDIESLLPHNESLFQKVNFLVQAAMGFINIEQNRIIKIFSLVSVIFLPPTLVASNYGMNFSFLPELKWKYGYIYAIIIMLISALAPYFYFKRKKWL
ncbi:magnesium/cobalt transporter CorA [Enterobacteriaceae endosymbiont of Donacia thalassina]|uniref:magnesium/cobalt transporter CorA n=1 Tax=Enterobacteriaceae endosymbiont of Donacia thalassina TaxID=2675786 RepID=UPI001449159E|nr:magnesium/cobalt transporter CorA [Enterobacteriaceae endosymbiont of Donacia thalassina]QJC37314.1 magnesium/cobalt transporter CorA [Enterobacteriaceae endosymbiont of Donacia thalassina]